MSSVARLMAHDSHNGHDSPAVVSLGRMLLLGSVLVALLAGCGSASRTPAATRMPPATPTATATPTPRPKIAGLPPKASCPANVTGCRSVRGRVVYVERVDPDGDGDLHVVLAGGAITLPGLSAVKVTRDLRPARTPRVGDGVAAAGPVQQGSHSESELHALVFTVRPAS